MRRAPAASRSLAAQPAALLSEARARQHRPPCSGLQQCARLRLTVAGLQVRRNRTSRPCTPARAGSTRAPPLSLPSAATASAPAPPSHLSSSRPASARRRRRPCAALGSGGAAHRRCSRRRPTAAARARARRAAAAVAQPRRDVRTHGAALRRAVQTRARPLPFSSRFRLSGSGGAYDQVPTQRVRVHCAPPAAIRPWAAVRVQSLSLSHRGLMTLMAAPL